MRISRNTVNKVKQVGTDRICAYFCIRGELKLIKDNIKKLNEEYDIFIQKGELEKFIDSKKNEFCQIITIKNNKIKLKELPVLFSIHIEKDTNLKNIIKKLRIILKKCYKKKINIGIKYKEKKIIGELIDDSGKERNTELIKCIKAVLIKDKRKRIEYIYDQVCEELDEEFAKNNYCDFKDDVCIGKRNCNERVTMGCCHKFEHPITMNGELKECPYLVDKHCSTQCITCKLFTCDAIKVKFKLKNIPLIECFFNPIQKLIVKTNFFTKREKIIDRLVLFNI